MQGSWGAIEWMIVDWQGDVWTLEEHAGAGVFLWHSQDEVVVGRRGEYLFYPFLWDELHSDLF